MQNRRSFLKLSGAALLVSAAPAALLWHQSEWNVDRMIGEIDRRLDEAMERQDFWYSREEMLAHQAKGGWPTAAA